MRSLLFIGFGGFFGSLARYAVSLAMKTSPLQAAFPVATLTVNFLGCLTIGFLSEVIQNSVSDSAVWAVFVTGFLGAFTTFSAFGLETLQLYRSGSSLLALANIGISLIGCLIAVMIGMKLGSLASY